MALPTFKLGNISAPNIPKKETLLQQTYLEAFRSNHDSVQRWLKWKEDHEQVKATMALLPDQLTHDVVIPFGSKALMKAKLVHTNEVLTCIGDKWFVKQSCKQAMEMCTRRIKKSEEILKTLESEHNLLLNRQNLPKLEEAFLPDDAQEIIEVYDEKKEAEWRVQHRQRERELKQKLAELRKQHKNEHVVQTDEDLFQRLDELELEEELNDELERLNAEYEANCEEEEELEKPEEEYESEDEEIEDQEEEEESENIKEDFKDQNVTECLIENGNSQESFNAVIEEYIDKQTPKGQNSPSQSGSKIVSTTRRVSFADDRLKEHCDSMEPCDPDIFIKFRHSKQPSAASAQFGIPHDVPEILSPSDIYDYYKALALKCQPKSILKNNHALPGTVKENVVLAQTQPFGYTLGLTSTDPEDDNNTTHIRDLSHLPPVLCNVQERTLVTSISRSIAPENNPERPMSRFKASRQGSKR